MRGRAISGSGLFLIELMLAIMIFALAAAICLRVFVASDQISAESVQLNRAVLSAQSSAESFKASGGDLNETARILSGFYEGVITEVQSDGSGRLAIVHDNIVEITRSSAERGLIEGVVTVSDLSGHLIFTIPVTVTEVTP